MTYALGDRVRHTPDRAGPAVTHAVRRAAVRATLAPSVHNTQPWRLVLRTGALDVYADWSRRLLVLDPLGRQLTISCGCAVFNARVALAAAGFETETARFPDAAQPDLLARLRVVSSVVVDRLPLAGLDPVVELRHTNRRRFADDAVPPDVVRALVEAAADESAVLVPIGREHRPTVARLSRQADLVENADPAYRAEVRAWTTDDPHRPDGLVSAGTSGDPAGTVDGGPGRDFGSRGSGWLPVAAGTAGDQCLLLLGTTSDTPAAWLRAGEALERVLLEVTRCGYVASPLTQVTEVARTSSLLRQELALRMHPHVLLRVGRAPASPATRRRRLVDVLAEADLPGGRARTGRLG